MLQLLSLENQVKMLLNWPGDNWVNENLQYEEKETLAMSAQT